MTNDLTKFNQTFTYYTLNNMLDSDTISEDIMISLSNVWIKHIKLLDEDCLIASTEALLAELRSLPQIPDGIGQLLEKTTEDFHIKSWFADLYKTHGKKKVTTEETVNN